MNKRLPLLMSLLGVILLAASLAYWIMQLYQPPQRPRAAAPHAALPDPPIDAAGTLFGGQVATVASNYQLTGIVSAGADSVAIIVAEGSPPKALRMGKELVPGITLAEVHPRYVMLSDGGVMKRLDLAADSKAAAPMGGVPGAPGAPGAVTVPPGGAMPATLAPGAGVPEPPMSPGAVQQQPAQPQEYATPGDVGQHDAPPPNPNSAPANPNAAPANPNTPSLNAPRPNNPAPTPVQMPPPTRATGSPVNSGTPSTQ